MANICSYCGNELEQNETICMKCGCAVKEQETKNKKSSKTSSPKAALILGILGIIFAWIFALIGHILSIIGIIIGIKEYKNTKKMTGLILSIIGEACSLLSSVLGALISVLTLLILQ